MATVTQQIENIDHNLSHEVPDPAVLLKPILEKLSESEKTVAAITCNAYKMKVNLECKNEKIQKQHGKLLEFKKNSSFNI